MTSHIKAANSDLDLSGKRCVVVGGTQGIGLAIARRLSAAGGTVVIVGRKAPTDLPPASTFIHADLSLVTGALALVNDLAALGPIDYLFQTQGGFMATAPIMTAEGNEARFMVQVASKFALTCGLADAGALHGPTVIVCAPGGHSKTFDTDDIQLERLFAEGKASIVAVAERDSVVLDAFVQEFNTRYPEHPVYHVWPGLVDTNCLSNSTLGQPLRFFMQLFNPIGMFLVGSKPDVFAEMPVWLATKGGEASAPKFINNKLKPMKPTPATNDPALRQRVWDTVFQIYK